MKSGTIFCALRVWSKKRSKSISSAPYSFYHSHFITRVNESKSHVSCLNHYVKIVLLVNIGLSPTRCCPLHAWNFPTEIPSREPSVIILHTECYPFLPPLAPSVVCLPGNHNRFDSVKAVNVHRRFVARQILKILKRQLRGAKAVNTRFSFKVLSK